MITITNTITIAIITISPGPNCAHIRPQSMGSGLQILLENLSRRSALPMIQLSTFPAESKDAIVNKHHDCEAS
jgi:hypothetical protein